VAADCDGEGSGSFGAGRDPWLSRQSNLRTVVRHELVARQLMAHLPTAPSRVLDVGAGQGTQAIRLARLGHHVVAVEPSATMRAAFEASAASEPADVRARLQVVDGALGRLAASERFDVVCCHGVLMYLAQAGPAVVELCDLVAPGGVVSLLARNADGMALRPGLRRDWAEVLTALDAMGQPEPRYTNEIGVLARADRLEHLAAYVSGRRMHVEAWYGVRVLTDGDDVERPAPDEPELGALLAAEERMGRTDPYRRLAALVHVVGRRDAVPPAA